MSRIGKQSVIIPEKTEVSVLDNVVSVKGPLGELTRTIHPSISVAVENNEVVVRPIETSLLSKSLWGTYSSHIKNMVKGVNEAFEKKLVVEGIGYRVKLSDSSSGKTLDLTVGYSHPVIFEIPKGITVVVEKNNIKISGPDKEQVGQFAAEVRASKKPEPYKGKGIRYDDEVVHIKQGKKTA